MSKYNTILYIIVVLASCHKSENSNNNTQLKNIVEQIAGTYYTTEICTSGTGNDTLYDVSIPVTSLNDTTLVINGQNLSFAGNLSTKNYTFSCCTSGNSLYSFSIDSNFQNFNFTSKIGNTTCLYKAYGKGDSIQYLISLMVGTYKAKEICYTDSAQMVINVDTTNNVPVIISSSGDSLVCNSIPMYFYSSTGKYEFINPDPYVSGAGVFITIDSTFQHFEFSIISCGINCSYANECDYYGNK